MRRGDIWRFVRLSRPLFLLGGLLLYGLGLAIAYHSGARLDLWLAISGQAFVSSVQLTIHYSNEYVDSPSDTINLNRTPFSGGSGTLGPDGLPRRTALGAAIVSLASAAMLAGRLVTRGDVPPMTWAIIALGAAVAIAYSTPPFRLVATGLGEALASITVAAIVPAIGFSLQTGGLSGVLLGATIPLIPLHFAMLLAFELPDETSDRATGKRTLVVRVGISRGIQLIRAAVGLGAVTLVAGAGIGLPMPVVLTPMLVSPVAFFHLHSLRPGRLEEVGWPLVTGAGLALFALTAFLEAVGFVVAGYA